MRTAHAVRTTALAAAIALFTLGSVCGGRPMITTPADQSAIDRSGSSPVEVRFPGGLPATAVVHLRLLAGIDAPPARTVDLDARTALAADRASATARLVPWELAAGRNTLFASVDSNGDGRTDLVASSTFRWDPDAAPDCRFDAGALPADALPPGTRHGTQIPIDHFVVLMQENRSFDHYLGQLHDTSQPDAEPVPAGASNPDPLGGPPIVPWHQTHTCDVADLGHSWDATHAEWDGGTNQGFTATNAVAADPSGARAMSYYTSAELPFYYALYSTFAMGDRYFSSVLSQTYPNRFYLLTGTSFGHIRNDDPFPLATEFSQRTIFQVLDEAGVSWKVYFSDLPYAANFKYARAHQLGHLVPIADYYDDAANGTLPAVAFVDTKQIGSENTAEDEHPVNNVQVGQAVVAQVVGALLDSPNWPSSAFVLTYDEHGGYWDHVAPPRACVPDDIPPLLLAGDTPGAFDRYGFRVPMVVVSPFARAHYVSHRIYDHTSILRLIEARFDLPALTRRDANADPMLDLFDFDAPPFLTPPALPAADIDLDEATRCNPGSPPTVGQ